MSARVQAARALVTLLAWLVPAAAAAQPAAPAPGVVAAWSQIGTADSLLVRAVTTATECPRLSVDGVALAMGPRARPNPDFPVTVCEASIARSTSAVTVDDVALPTMRRFPERIVVLGDTGCRLRGTSLQACNDPDEWPFARIAARAAALRPDLVIHTGDFFARETPCPPGVERCAGSPSGDNWASWTEDVFAPAAPLLAAAPWLVVRGTTEACGRASEGWFRLLDPHPRSRGCLRFTEPYIASFGPWQIAAIDSAEADERAAPPALVEEYTRQIDGLVAANFVSAWMVSHRPIWAAASDDVDGAASLRAASATLQASARNLPDGIGAIFSGRYHVVQALGFGDRRPATVIVGNGGTLFDRPARTLGVGDVIDGLPVRVAMTVEHRHGFALVERDGEGWRLTFLGVDGAPLGRCRLLRRALDCAN